MKQYPSINSCTGTTFREIPNAYVFDKLDGSNLRFEWSKKQGWYKYGTRYRMMDRTDLQFGLAIPLFEKTLAEPLAKIARDQRWERVTVFAEWWGKNSFAGFHDALDDKHLDLIDISVHKKGFLDPKEFIKLTENLPRAAFLGRFNWTRGFIKEVWEDRVPGITLEGVVAKLGSGEDHDRLMAKAKTKTWITKVREKFAPEDAERLVNS